MEKPFVFVFNDLTGDLVTPKSRPSLDVVTCMSPFVVRPRRKLASRLGHPRVMLASTKVP